MDAPRWFRKLPVLVEAIRWTGDNPDAVAEFIGDRDVFETEPGTGRRLVEIPTLEGVMTADPGDWLIRGVASEVYPCKPDVFTATYEPAAPPPEDAARA